MKPVFGSIFALAPLAALACGSELPPHDHGSHSHGGAGGSGELPVEELPTTAYDWQLPDGFPEPWEPLDNPTTVEKVELGRHLFYDVRLSRNDETSCATCHRQELAFTDGRVTAVGTTGESHPRNSMTLANVGYASTLTWAHPLLVELERQALVPLFGEDPVEMGAKDADALERKLKDVDIYVELFAAAYPSDEERGTLAQMTQALGAFQRTLISGNSPYDRWIQNDETEDMSEAARRGYALFHSEKLECFHCHSGFNLTDHVHWASKAFYDAPFHNTGLYDVDGKGAYPEPNTGTFDVTLKASDMGRFKAPTLRNVAVTAPYMHDGSITTLSEVLDHYAAGGRTIHSGPHAGDGRKSPLKDPLVVGFELSEDERRDVIAFLESLTDEEFLNDPRFSNPW